MVRNLKMIAPKSILVVDDEPMVANTLRLLLRMKGHQVELADDGEKALALYEKGKFDLVVTDFSMPGMDGLELARVIRERVPEQPIIMISAYADAVTSDEKRRLNIDAVLGKPFSVQQLQDALISVFPGG